jgi:hypothetical protein
MDRVREEESREARGHREKEKEERHARLKCTRLNLILIPLRGATGERTG